MNATVSGLIEAIKLAINGVTPPYSASNYPSGLENTRTNWDYISTGGTSWFKFGAGGIVHWGTACGVPIGCAQVLNLMNLCHSGYTTHQDQVMNYFCQTAFPTADIREVYEDPNYTYLFRGKVPMPESDVKAHVISNSPLCHVGISKWCWHAGVQMNDMGTQSITHKVDRCAKMAAATAAFTAGLLNTLTQNYHIPEETEACEHCHNHSSYTATALGPAQQGYMDCGECHTDLRAHGSAAMGYPPMVDHGAVTVSDMTVSFNDASTDSDNAQATLKVEVNWGDGGVSTGVGGGLFSHDYAATGKFTITHSVQDPAGNFASEIIKVAVGMYGLTVSVLESGNDPVVGATVYLKQKKGSGDWKQIMYGYTDSAGSKTYTDLPGGAMYSYKVVVYRSGFDFNTGATGIQTKVTSTVFTLTADKTLTIQQGNPPTITIA